MLCGAGERTLTVVASVPKSHLDMAQNNSYNAAQAARDRSALKAQIARDRAAAARNGQNNRRTPPRPKAAPQRGNAQRRAGPQRRSRLSFDSFSPAPMPLAFSVGRCTRLQGLSRGDFYSTATHPDKDYMLAVFNGSPGAYVGRCYSVSTENATASTVKFWNMTSAGFDPHYGAEPSAPSASRPDHAMCAKFSVRIRNISKAIDVGGVVRVLNMSAGTSGNSAKIPELINLIHYVEAHPRTVTFGASELRSTHQFDTHPVDQNRYHSFQKPSEDILGWDAALENPAMSTIVMVIPVFANNQYEVTANGHYYARYDVSGPLANMASPPPIADMSALNRARDEAEALGSKGYKAAGRIVRHAEPYVGASLGRAVGGMIEGAALA